MGPGNNGALQIGALTLFFHVVIFNDMTCLCVWTILNHHYPLIGGANVCGGIAFIAC
jgi:hypothetical protein